MTKGKITDRHVRRGKPDAVLIRHFTGTFKAVDQNLLMFPGFLHILDVEHVADGVISIVEIQCERVFSGNRLDVQGM